MTQNIPPTRSFAQTVRDRAAVDPEFAQALVDDEQEADKCACGLDMPRSVICVELKHLPDGSLQRVREWIEIDE